MKSFRHLTDFSMPNALNFYKGRRIFPSSSLSSQKFFELLGFLIESFGEGSILLLMSDDSVVSLDCSEFHSFEDLETFAVDNFFSLYDETSPEEDAEKIREYTSALLTRVHHRMRESEDSQKVDP